MATPILVAQSFELGFKSDFPRDQLPPGSVFRMKDYLPREGAEARRRGAFQHASRDLQEVAPVGSSNIGLRSGVWAPFPNDPHLVVSSGWGDVFRVAEFDGNDGNLVAGGGEPAFRPVWHKDKVILPSSLGGATVPRKYYEQTAGAGDYTVANLGGTPPAAKVAAGWGDYLVLGRINTNLAQVRWSDPGTVDVWNALSTYTAPEEVMMIVARKNQQFIFGPSGVHLLIGDTPPPGGNLSAFPFNWAQGTPDGRSVSVYGDSIIWANQAGVWRSDGATVPMDITETGGISRYWRSLTKGFILNVGMAMSAGVMRGYYIVSILTRDVASPYTYTAKTLVCDLDRLVWFEWLGMDFIDFATRRSSLGTGTVGSGRVTGEEELFAFSAKRMNVERLSPCFDVFGGVDPNATYTPKASLETGFIKLGVESEKRFRRAFITHDISPTHTEVPEKIAAGLAVSTAGGTTLPLSVPVYIPAGAWLFAFVCSSDGNATDVTTPAGWTKLGQARDSAGGCILAVYFKIAKYEPSVSYTWDFTGAASGHERVGGIIGYTGAKDLVPVALSVGESVASTLHDTQAIEVTESTKVLSFWGFDVAGVLPIFSHSTDMTLKTSVEGAGPNAVIRMYESTAEGKGILHELSTSTSVVGGNIIFALMKPRLAISSVTDPDESVSYSVIRYLRSTLKTLRRAVFIGRRGNGIALKIEQDGDLAADISLRGLELDAHVLEGSND